MRSVSHDSESVAESSTGHPAVLRVVKHLSDKTPKKPFRNSWNMDGDEHHQLLSSLPEDEISTDYTFGVSGITNPSAFGSLLSQGTFDSLRRHDSVDMNSFHHDPLGRLDEEKEDDISISSQDRSAFNPGKCDTPPQIAKRMLSWPSEWSIDLHDINDRFEEREPTDQDKPVTPPKRSKSQRKSLSKLREAFRSRFAIGKRAPSS